MIMKNALLVFLAYTSLSEGFTTTNGVVSSRQTSSSASNVVLRLSSPEEERAAVLSNYLAKAHEDKLRAVQAAEAKKNEEIIRLKEMLKESQAQGPAEIAAPAPGTPTATLTISEPPVDPNLLAMSPEALVNLVQKYKHFVANYVADAQKQKAEAVQAAEEALTQKYEARLQALGGGGIPAAAAEVPFKVVESAPKAVEKAPAEAEAPPPQVYAAAQPTDLYAKRNARLEAAALAGKTRWGSMEVAKVAIDNAKNPQAAVEEADHGLRNDGGVGGPTLAERVSMGAGSDAPAATPQVAKTPHFADTQVAGSAPLVNGSPEPVIPSVDVAPLYAKRNAKVVASAKVGKSRWGEMEIEKIKTSVNANSDAEIAAADHGLRNDGGVSGPSLAERVNLGAMLLGVDPLGSDTN